MVPPARASLPSSVCAAATLGRIVPSACLAALLFAPGVMQAEDWAPNLTLMAISHDNASNAESSDDQIDTLQISADLIGSDRYAFGQADALVLTGHFAGEWWPRYDHLLGGAAGGRAGWWHTFGTGNFAPVFSIEGSADAFDSKEQGRRGTLVAGTVGLRKRFNDRWRASITHEFAQRAARFEVYDQDGSTTTVQLAHDFSKVARISVSGLFRTGDVLTYSGNPREEVAAIAAAEREVETFGRPMTVYSVDAKTWGARVEIARALDDYSAIVAAFDWRMTEKNPVQFTNHQLSIGIVHQF